MASTAKNPFKKNEDQKILLVSLDGYRLYVERAYFDLDMDSSYINRYTIVNTIKRRRFACVETIDTLGRKFGVKINGAVYPEDRLDRLSSAIESARQTARCFTDLVRDREKSLFE